MTPTTAQLPRLREAAGLSQTELGRLLGDVSQSTVKSWECRGRIPAPWLPRLAAVLQCTVNDLLGIPTELTPPDVDKRTLAGQIYEKACKLPPKGQQAILATIQAMLSEE